MAERIYLSPPDVGEAERALLLEAFDSGWIAPLGPSVDAFEQEFERVLGIPAVALSSGTAALHLALRILGIGPGDVVVVPTLTFVATANVVTYVGARPVFIDSTPSDWNIDPGLLHAYLNRAAAQGRLPRAVIPVDLYGQCAAYDEILETCAHFEVPVIEDAAEAIGARYQGRPAGTFGSIAAFSFNGNKLITSSGGGMLVSERREWVDQARRLATQARDPAPHYEHSEVGFNYRLSNLLAAVGLGQLRGLERRVRARRKINEYYRSGLSDLPGLAFMPVAPHSEPNYWLTCITVDPMEFGATREDVRLGLEAINVESRPTWKPMHLQPLFHAVGCEGGAVAQKIFERGLCLPSGTAMSQADLDRVIEVIRAHAAPR